MRQVPDELTRVWHSGNYTGDQRPIARVTVQQARIRLHRTADNLYATLPFGSTKRPKELPNVKSVSWDRSVDADTATATITFYNTDPLPVGETPTRDLDRPGWYTYNRGGATYSVRWGHSPNQWSGLLVPDNLLYTFEGYGFQRSACPEDDPYLVQTGVWMIDDVEYTHDGLITATCRDFGRLLLDQIAFPPVVPFRAGPKSKDHPQGAYAYPVSFMSRNDAPTVTTVQGEFVPFDPKPLKPVWDDDSGTPYVGHGGSVYGHYGRHAFDRDSGSYWLSIGNARGDQGYSFEWVQARIPSQTVSQVRLRTKYAGYTCYLSLLVGDTWLSRGMIPYDPNHPASAPNGSNIPFYRSIGIGSETWHTINLNPSVDNVRKIRLTFANLPDTGLGTYQHRAAVREITVFGGPAERRKPDRQTTTRHHNKNYEDYTQIPKMLLAWAGFYWPEGAETVGCDGAVTAWPFNRHDRFLGKGRIWGDLEATGTNGPAPIPASVFDKKPLMEGLNYVRDVVGFIFYVDEYGGAVWRPPNIYTVGNLYRSLGSRSGTRSTRMLTIDERRTLIGLRASLSSRNVRERIFVANTDGRKGALARGYNPNPIGLRRVAGWTDQHFETQRECRVMADLIALRQLFSYRTDTVTIPGYPAVQVDDQVRIFEAVTSEGFIHYVKGISSSNDLESGEWTYDLDTHWLGERPFKRWIFHPADLARETRQYLHHLFGRPTTGGVQPPPRPSRGRRRGQEPDPRMEAF